MLVAALHFYFVKKTYILNIGFLQLVVIKWIYVTMEFELILHENVTACGYNLFPLVLDVPKHDFLRLTGQISAFLRNVPSPEQGTSHRTRSKRRLTLALESLDT